MFSRAFLRSSLATLALATATLAPVQAAHADDDGATGRVSRLTINTQGSEKYASFHGSVALKKPGSKKSVTYFWGGSTCPAQRLDANEVALLATALRGRILVAPRYRTGEGARGARCLVAFELIGR